MRGIIAAVSPEGVIGLHGALPWRHPGDQRRFKRVTLGSVVIMGRKTWESVSGRPLPNRRNVVITRDDIVGVSGIESFRDLTSALAAVGDSLPIWFIGGARIYEDAMPLSDIIDLTYVPERIEHPDAVKFPDIPAAEWTPGPLVTHEDEPELTRRIYTRAPSRLTPLVSAR